MIKFVFLFIVVFIVPLKGQSTCDYQEFPCYNGECIERGLWCDTEEDCRDKSDERFCSKGRSPGDDPNGCKLNSFFFLCTDGTCIPATGRCDETWDCPDHSDEKDCSGIVYANNYQHFNEISHNSTIEGLSEVEKDQNRPNFHFYRYNGESNSYEDLPYTSYRSRLDLARTWLKSQQNDDLGWGDYTARAIIAMYLSKGEGYEKTEDDFLMDKQLDIELSIALTRNDTRTISLSELALYINALLAACKNPRNFYGYDLVNILRERVDSVYSKNKFVSPLVNLALCLANATAYGDIRLLQETKYKQNIANKIDIISLAVLASSCTTKIPLYSHALYRRNIVQMLLNKVKESGLPGNIYEAALVMQALNEAKVDPREWERDEAIEFILRSQSKNGSFGDILATYYTIPILSGNSILSLSDRCSKDFSNGKTPLAILKNARRRKITVNYSLLFGNPVEMTQKVQLQIPERTNFLDIMRLAEEENPNFRFQLDETKKDPFVYSIGGTPNDAECGRYWTLYIQNSRNATDFFPYGKDIRELELRDGEEVQFWWKQL